jgi:IMP dehydrogenase
MPIKLRPIPLGLTYDDVLLVPQKSDIRSRSQVVTRTKVSRNISIAIPFVSSNIDTVTDSSMAIAMAKLGGIGMIHRFMTIEKEVEQVKKVKRSEGFIMGTPFTIGPDMTVKEAKMLMRRHGVSSAIIVNDSNKVLGLVSERDMWFLEDDSVAMKSLMTPAKKLITAPVDVTLAEARKLFRMHKIEKLPLVASNGSLEGLITSRTVLNEDIYPQATKDSKGRLRVGAAVGVVDDYEERTRELLKAGVDIIVADIAHVHSIHGITAIKRLRKICDRVDLVVGNIASPEAARDMARLDVDGVKVGIGPGGICITRIVAGAGYPQFSAVRECAPILQQAKIPLMADGGTNYSGDMSKALAAGASCMMIAGWLAGTDESPGAIIYRKGQKYKVHRGAASFSAVASRKIAGLAPSKVNQLGLNAQVRKELAEQEMDAELEDIVPEGVESFIPYKGPVKDVVHQLVGAVKSGMSYCNAKTVPEMWKNARFVQITSAGLRESTQHNVDEM